MRNRLKELRARSNLTQEVLANKLDISRQTVNSIEKERFNPSLELAFKLAKYFDCKIEEIFIYEK